MPGIESLAPIFACIAAGLAVGRFGLLPRGRMLGRLVNICLYALLIFMGFRIGRSGEIASSLASIGLLSLLFTAATLAGTATLLCLYDALSGRPGNVEPASAPPPAAGVRAGRLGEPIILLVIVVAGFGLGLVPHIVPGWNGGSLTSWLLWVLLFLVGADLAGSGLDIGRSLTRPETLVLPLLTALGSLAGGALLSLAVGLPVAHGLSVAAGFGWYSLSGVLITDLGDPRLGSVAFLSNIMRESFALLTIPLIARTRRPHLCIGIAGATSMDVSLPLIERSCGPATVPLAVASGAILSMLVPVLVPLLYGIG